MMRFWRVQWVFQGEIISLLSRLIDLLDDSREIIRNAGLLLLLALTKSNAEIQKIVAFENAFEKLLGIVIEEGASDGDIIVQDCMEVIHNLLRFNVSNQVRCFSNLKNLFRETSCIQKIPQLLGNLSTGEKWPAQKIKNTLAVLELIRILVAPKNSNARVNQVSALHLLLECYRIF